MTRTRALVLTALWVILVDDLLQVALIPVLPTYYQTFHLNTLQVGLILSAGPLVTVAFGWLVARIIALYRFQRRGILCAGLACSGTAALLYGYAGNWLLLLLAASFQGIAVLLVLPTVMESVADAFDKEHRGRVVSRLDALVSVGALFSPAAVAALFSLTGVHRSFIVICGAMMIMIPTILLQSGWKSIEAVGAGSTAVSEAAPHATLAATSAAGSAFAAGVFELIAPLRLSLELKFSPSMISMYLFALGIGFALPQWWVSSWLRRFDAKVIACVGAVGIGIGFAVLGFLQGWYLVFGGLCLSPFAGVFLALSANLAGGSENVSGTFTFVEVGGAAGYLCGALGVGASIDLMGQQWALFYAAAMYFLFFGFLLSQRDVRGAS
ncbi:MAG: MFS transporter [Bacilli bacterium]